MHKPHRPPPIILICFGFFLLTSCQWKPQNDSPQQTDKAGQQDSEWVDPLFEIEGQLCQHLRVIYQDRQGDLWFGTNVYGLIRYNGDTLEYFDRKNGLNFGRVTGILEDDTGHMWIGTSSGLVKWDGKIFTFFDEKDGLINHEIWSLTRDSNGLFWIGHMEGVSQFDGKAFSTFEFPKARVADTNSILSYDRVSSILEDRNGRFWFGTDGFGIARYDPFALQNDQEAFTHFTKANGLPDNNIADIFEDRNGDIWIGTMYGGVSRYDGKNFHNLNQDGTLRGTEAYGFYEDRQGNLWFAVEHKGVYRYDGEAFTNYNKQHGLRTGGVICIYEDRDNRFWVGGWLGLFRFDGERFFPVTKNGPWE